jgi:leucyl-tRNA synthetase
MAEDIPKFRYDAAQAQAIETRWQERWEKLGTFTQPNPGQPGFDATKPKFYALDMFPYPSGAGLHVGHPEGYIATDILCRYKRMRGFNVLHPMGWDAFGLPAEQYAIQTGVHPANTTRAAIETFRKQLKRFGFSYDWSREFGTIEPDYYKWTQWIFLQFYAAYFDAEANRARPMSTLIQAFERGERPVRWNPDATEISAADKERTLPPWSQLDAGMRRRVLDSYRLAYRAKQTVNWCPKLGTALANEEVIDGKSERGGHPVFRKALEQWMLRMTAFAQRLLQGHAGLDWPASSLAKQSSWIGFSIGAEVNFRVLDVPAQFAELRVFTTRPDTLFGATYMVIAPEHPLLAAAADSGELRDYVRAARDRSDLERQQSKEKTGVFTGLYAHNPATEQKIPIWVSDYVLMGYGTGAIMAVPAHDERDFEFATQFELPIRRVVEPEQGAAPQGVFSGDGKNVDSANAGVSLNGLSTPEAKRTIVAWLEQQGIGKTKHNTKLRDWLFSRQRYWGEPFPIVFDRDGQHYAIRADKLPLMLPTLADYQPEESDEPRPLLAKAQAWMHTTAGEAGIDELPPETPVVRETNTMPNWAGSCWYYLRFADPKNPNALIGREADRYWMGSEGVDLYVGGAEHVVLHLLYARVWHQLLFDLGHVGSPEPFHKLYHQGLILSFGYERADGSPVPNDQVEERSEGVFVEKAGGAPLKQVIVKMSKSLRNVVNPDQVILDYGADTFRLYEMYMGPLDASKPWNTRDIAGLSRFLQRTWRLLVDEQTGALQLAAAENAEVEKQLHRTLAKVGSDIERLAFNTAIAALIGFVNTATGAANAAGGGGLTRSQAERLALMLAPFTPHLAEEFWSRLGHDKPLAHQAWPSYDEAMLHDDSVEVPVQIMGKVRHRIIVPSGADGAALEALALADPKVKELLAGKTVRKIVTVPGKLINIVAN